MPAAVKKSPFLFPLIITFIIAVLFYPTLLLGRIPIPADLLVGAYYPWLNSTWGYPVGVPIKNPAISDVFSQLYPWKILVADSYRHFRLPLWNPYSFSGYPLLANLQSGALYPFNIIIILLGNLSGWSAFLIFGTLGSALSLYFFCRTLGFSRLASAASAITYACSGFAVTWMQFANATQAMVWLPLLLCVQERFYQSQRRRYLLFLPFIIFLLITSGHFQIAVFSIILACLYHLYRRSTKYLAVFMTFIILGLGLSAAQLIPSFELFNLSVRTNEHYVEQSNYGLLPIGQLATIFAPDFFGNPVRGNHWGFGQYHESLFYAGIWAAISLIFCLYDWRHLGKTKFFLLSALISFLLGFDTPLGRLIYTLKIPLLSTSYAGRIFVISTFSLAILSAYTLDRLSHADFREKLRRLWPIVAFFISITAVLFICRHLLAGDYSALVTSRTNLTVSLRNLVLPVILTTFLSICFLLSRFRFFRYAILFLLSADLLIFAQRYLPFVKPGLVFPTTPEITFVKDHIGSSRILTEPGEIFPANTWISYQLRSPIGYDPLLIAGYFRRFSLDVNHQAAAGLSRYLSADSYSSADLAKYSVKYFFVLKRGPKGVIPGDSLNYRINPAEWSRVFQSDSVAVLENPLALPRARLDIAKSSAAITLDTPQTVAINYSTPQSGRLTLADTWYPGWSAAVNGKSQPISASVPPFRTLTVPAGSGTVVFHYLPPSFLIGLLISILSASAAFFINLLSRPHHSRNSI